MDALFAGMPSINLSDVARMRLQSISFFLAALLLSAAAIKALWNYLGKDFTFLPRLTYGKALGVVVLWGLLFVLVLTMISGARELMTPGAWEKQGLTYKLVQNTAPVQVPTPTPPDLELDRQRQIQLDSLRVYLWDYARAHEGRFPAERLESIPRERWLLPGGSGMYYLYVPGLTTQTATVPLAYEPEVFGGDRLVLLTDGQIRRMSAEAIARAGNGGKP